MAVALDGGVGGRDALIAYFAELVVRLVAIKDVKTEPEESSSLGAVTRRQPLNTRQTGILNICCGDL